jgi:hypothetical protein
MIMEAGDEEVVCVFGEWNVGMLGYDDERLLG